MKHLFIVGLLTFFVVHVSRAVVITGNNSGYAGEKLVFYRWSDPVTLNEIPVFEVIFNSEGRFRAEVNITATTFVYCDFGMYRGMLFLQPSQNLELLMPPKKVKSFADEKNPFFEPVAFWFRLAGSKGLNHEVSAFDQQFDQFTGKYFNQLYFRQSQQVLDSVKNALATLEIKPADPSFDLHKSLKIKLLEIEVLRLDTKKAAVVFASAGKTQWTHPAFVQGFGKVFDNRLSFDAKGIDGSALQKAVNRADAVYLIKHIRDKYISDIRTANLVMLKMIHDGWYSGDFSRESLLMILESEILVKNEDPYIREITSSLTEKLKFLSTGTTAPVICLKDTDGNRQCSNSDKEKFKYVIFADDEMVVCREHLKYLPVIVEKFGKYLEIILVMRKTDLIEMKMFLDKNRIPGIKLVDNNGEFTRKFGVKSFPSCYLFDKNHRIAMESVKSPLDGFEQQFGRFLQMELFERQRKGN